MAWGEEGIGGTERLLVVIASIVGLFGIIAAMIMFHNLDIIPEGIMVAAVCMLFTIWGWYRLAKEFRDRPEHLPLKPWEDLGTAVVLVLPHAAVFSIFMQLHYSFLMSFPAEGGEYSPNEPSGAYLEYNPATGGCKIAMLSRFVALSVSLTWKASLSRRRRRQPAAVRGATGGGNAAGVRADVVPHGTGGEVPQPGAAQPPVRPLPPRPSSARTDRH